MGEDILDITMCGVWFLKEEQTSAEDQVKEFLFERFGSSAKIVDFDVSPKMHFRGGQCGPLETAVIHIHYTLSK